ncbi:hypothetical protein KRMM14A1259_49340 [Krasilnikovia sp. MM14-A1259]
MLVGGLSYLIDVCSLMVLHVGFGVPLTIATTIAFCAVLVVNFGLNRAFAFRDTGIGGVSLARYLVLVAGNYVATLAVVSGLTAITVPLFVAKTLSTMVNAITNYGCMRWWVFRVPREPYARVSSSRRPSRAASPRPPAARR